jgi:hypothetical protein
LSRDWWIAQANVRHARDLAAAEISVIVVYAGSLLMLIPLGRTKVELDFLYLVSFDSQEFRVPGAAAIFGLADVENKGFVAFFKQLLNAIDWGFLGVQPAPFEMVSRSMR